MKKIMLAVVIMVLFSGCASMRKDVNNKTTEKTAPEPKKQADPSIEKKMSELENLNDWFSYPVAQSKILKYGNPIIQPYLREGIYFEMYYDEEQLKNYPYFDHKLKGDIGRKGQTVKEGFLYINPADKAALYYYPRKEGEFDVFKVRIKFQLQQ